MFVYVYFIFYVSRHVCIIEWNFIGRMHFQLRGGRWKKIEQNNTACVQLNRTNQRRTVARGCDGLNSIEYESAPPTFSSQTYVVSEYYTTLFFTLRRADYPSCFIIVILFYFDHYTGILYYTRKCTCTKRNARRKWSGERAPEGYEKLSAVFQIRDD